MVTQENIRESEVWGMMRLKKLDNTHVVLGDRLIRSWGLCSGGRCVSITESGST
jgi:hypothetical protein